MGKKKRVSFKSADLACLQRLIGRAIIFKTFCFQKAKLLVFKDSLLYVLGIFMFFTSKHAGTMSQYLQMSFLIIELLSSSEHGLIYICHGNEERSAFWIQIKITF